MLKVALLGISRSSLYYLATEAGAEDLELMALIDQQYLKTPFYGSRRMTAWLRNHGYSQAGPPSALEAISFGTPGNPGS